MTPNEHVWAFDLGKGSIGEAVRQQLGFPHIASLLIPAELARRGPASVSGTPASRYRAMKTREAHHERERWLETVWTEAGLRPLQPREVWLNPSTNKWELKHKADYRLEREFAPNVGEKTKDGAPSDEAGASLCYTSCLLRIRLLQGDRSLAEWQIYKALRAALQRRGYGPVPWAAKEARKQGKTPEELQRIEDKKLQQSDPRYREALGKWPDFKRSVPAEFHFPCYYDARKMGLWRPDEPSKLLPRSNHLADSTRNVRFDRADVRAELVKLGDQAAAMLPALGDAFARWQPEGWKFRHPVTAEELSYPVQAKTFGEFFCDGPAGKPDETSFEAFLTQRRDAGVHRGSFEEWMAALGQKTPSFDNRILNDCVLFPRYHVCKVDVRLETDEDGNLTGKLVPESLLASEVASLLKLKNLLMADAVAGQRMLKVEELREVFGYSRRQLEGLRLVSAEGELVKNWPGNVADCFAIKKSKWGQKKALGKLGLRPMPGHEEVKAPRTSGRSAYSRVALRILKELILSGETPSAFHARLLRRDAELLVRLGPSPEKPVAFFDDSAAADEQQRKQEDTENRKRGLLVSELRFLLQMRKDNAAEDSWENIFIPSQTLDALQQRHTEDGKLDADAAIRELLGTINDPIVRHRLEVFDKRLKRLQLGDKEENLPGFGVPDAIVLEFVREDFMGEEALKKYRRFLNERAEERKTAKQEAAKLGLESRSSGLRYELFKAQGGICLYTGKPLSESRLDEYEIDHIVPRSMGGPDAAVNYVLTFHDLNHSKEKGKLIPYALLHGKEGWDAYVERVKARASTLRNKKVQLLTREDAPELVERYTALAETAWVSKLAQTIVNLRFGWTNGYDEKRRKRVIVVSGGLTARVRRKYSLDKLLYTDVTDPEVLAKKVKNRADKRHHALDAMVLTFIPQWARDPKKEGFFRFPAELRDSLGREDYDRVREVFSRHLAQITPRNLAYERPSLQDTNYGLRRDSKGEVVVRRLPVRDLAYVTQLQRETFDLDHAEELIKRVRDDQIRARLRQQVAELSGLSEDHREPAWLDFCKSFRQISKTGVSGALIQKVLVSVGPPSEFADFSKDGCGTFKKRKENHKGQLLYLDGKQKPRVAPVYVFESVPLARSRLRREQPQATVIGFFESGCLVRLEQPVPHARTPLSPGTYRLNSLREDGRAELTTASGQKSERTTIAALLKAGFKRVD